VDNAIDLNNLPGGGTGKVNNNEIDDDE